MQKLRFSHKLNSVELWSLLTTYSYTWTFFIGSLKSKMAEIRHLNRHDVIFFCRGWSDWDKILETGAEWHVDCGDLVEIETRFRIPIRRTFGRIEWYVIPEPRATCHIAGCCHLANSMSWFQSYVSYCRVLPLVEFTVTIPEPHATSQGAVTWRNQCHDRATLQGVRIPSAILKIVFRHI